MTEEPPAPLKDTTYVNAVPSAPQTKRVLFEDFTGVHCPTCPNGHEAIQTMKANHPGRIVAVAIHPTTEEFNQAFPYTGEDSLNTNWASDIFTIITKPGGIPFGIADRVNGTLNPAQWESLVTSRLSAPCQANVELSVLSFDPATRELKYEVKMELTEDLNIPLYFSMLIMEDSIIQSQERQGVGHIHNYVHNHILRDMHHFRTNLNPSNEPPAVKGRVFLKQYSYTFPAGANWKPEHCHLVVYIHKSVDVLQVTEIKIR